MTTRQYERKKDLHWVRDLTVPMHLGLINGPFMPHNLISAQGSPAPLPKFHMAPRLKILISSGFKKGTQRILSFSLKKSRQANPLHVPQRGPDGERYLRTGDFYVSLNISLFYLSLRVPGKGAPSMFPNKVPLNREPPPCSLTRSP